MVAIMATLPFWPHSSGSQDLCDNLGTMLCHTGIVDRRHCEFVISTEYTTEQVNPDVNNGLSYYINFDSSIVANVSCYRIIKLSKLEDGED